MWRWLVLFIVFYGIQALPSEDEIQVSKPIIREIDTSKPLYEAGVGMGAFYAPHYPGANQYRDRYIGLPFFIYRGKVLKADDEVVL